jgi:hypothetical protein
MSLFTALWWGILENDAGMASIAAGVHVEPSLNLLWIRYNLRPWQFFERDNFRKSHFDWEESAPFPQFEPVRRRTSCQLPIPAETPGVSATPSLRGFAGETVPHPLPSTDSRERWPMAILLRRSFLRCRPSASRSGRGVAEESLTRLRTPLP